MKKLLFSIFVLSIAFLASCSKDTNTETTSVNEEKSIKIVASVPPIASIANYIGWEYVSVSSLIEPGFSPHTFDLKPSQIIAMEKADFIIATGLGIDSFIEKNIQEEKHILLKESVQLIKWEEHNHDHGEHEAHTDEHHDEHWHEAEHHDEHWHEDEHHDGHHDEHEAEHSNTVHNENEEVFFDPHLWLSLENGEKIAEKITHTFSLKNPENKIYFEKNLENFKKKSEEIKNNFSKKTENKQLNNFVIFHEAYGYLFQEMNIDETKVIVLQETAGRETSVSEMKHIVDEINEHKVKVLYKEPQLDTKLIDTLVEKHSLQLSELDPLGKSIEKNGYFNTMESNLNNLLISYE